MNRMSRYNVFTEVDKFEHAYLIEQLVKECAIHYNLKYWGMVDKEGRTLQEIQEKIKEIKKAIGEL